MRGGGYNSKQRDTEEGIPAIMLRADRKKAGFRFD